MSKETIALIPIMNSLISDAREIIPTGIVEGKIWDWYDRNPTTSAVSSIGLPVIFGFKFYRTHRGFPVVTKYTMQSRNRDVNDLTAAPKSWTLEGSNDGVSWDVLDRRQDIKWSSKNQTLTFETLNKKSYERYVIKVTANNGYRDPLMTLAGFQLYGYFSINKLIVQSNKEYYYYDKINTNWKSLGFDITLGQLLQYGMEEINSEINELTNLTGDLRPKIYSYTDGEASTNIKMKATPLPQLVCPTNDISLIGIEVIDKVTLSSVDTAKIAISFDSCVTWKAYKNGAWEIIENAHSGMTDLEVNALTSEQIELGRNGSTHIRFSYSLAGDAKVDNIEMKVSLQGYEKLANTRDFDIEHDSTRNAITFKIKKDGTYSVNYVDS